MYYLFLVTSEPIPIAPDKTTVKDIKKLCKDNKTKEIKKSIDGWQDQEVNICITGASCVGKSTFINTMRGISSDHEGAAKVGEGDCTRSKESYPHPDNAKIVFWDIPGFGTSLFKSKSKYLKMAKLKEYDYVIFMFCDTIYNKQNTWMIKEIQNAKRKFCIVRTHVDSKMKKQGLEEFIKSDKEAIRKELVKRRIDPKIDIFAISNVNTSIGEFDLLLKALPGKLSNEKRESLLYTLGVLSDDLIEEKRAMLKQRSWKSALGLSTAVSSPVPGVGTLCVMFLVDEISFYRDVFQLNDNNLRCIPASELKKLNISFRMFDTDLAEFLKTEIPKLAMLYVADAVSDIIVPIIGSFLFDVVSYPLHVKILHGMIDRLAEDAKILRNIRTHQFQ